MRAPSDLSQEETVLVECALGRIFRIGSRPEQPGDVAEYERCRNLILDVFQAEPEHLPSPPLPGWNFGRGNSGVIE